MSIFLVAPALDLSIELAVSDEAEQALAQQMARLRTQAAIDDFGKRIARQVESVLLDSIDWDIKEPTPAQVSFAMVLSKRLNIAIPPEALRFRGAMHEFLARHADKPNGVRTPITR